MGLRRHCVGNMPPKAKSVAKSRTVQLPKVTKDAENFKKSSHVTETEKFKRRAEKEYAAWIPSGRAIFNHLKKNGSQLSLDKYQKYLLREYLPAMKEAHDKEQDESSQAATQTSVRGHKRNDTVRFERGEQVCCCYVLENIIM